MELNNIIEKLNINLKDVKEHKADYCHVPVEDVEAIIEYLEQLEAMIEDK